MKQHILSFSLLCSIVTTPFSASGMGQNKPHKKQPHVQRAQSQQEQTALDSALLDESWKDNPSLSKLKELCLKGASVNNCFLASSQTGHYSRSPTPLSLASSARNIPAMKLFLEHGANVDVQDALDNTPLVNAITPGRNTENIFPAVKLLLSYGANSNIPNSLIKIPLSLINPGYAFSEAATMQKYIKETLELLHIELLKKNPEYPKELLNPRKIKELRSQLTELQRRYTDAQEKTEQDPNRKLVGALLSHGAKMPQDSKHIEHHLKERAIATHRALGIDFNQKVTNNKMHARARARRFQERLFEDIDDEKKEVTSKVTEWPRNIR